MNVPGWLLPHRITVEAYAGDSAYGPTYRAPVADVPAMVAATVRTVRDPEGREVTATAQVITASGLDCPAESRITLPDGRTTRALTVSAHTAPGLPVPQSVEVVCE
ncbi:hypothetical protein [Streptomyces montanisoli]|uniref:hypothetical protein n=1 Tax=Streptomyces montanisoli TaxID=2798581 RepID=UPI0027DE8C87|nr:hypothetical protein [Streptomyces montanisoli]